MIEWITEHWQPLVGWGSTIGGAIWTAVSAHHGKIRAGFRWLRKQSHLRSENAKLTARLAEKDKLLEDKTILLADSDAKVEVQAKLLEPPALDEGEINIIRFLAVRGIPIESYRLCFSFEMERTRFDHYLNRLTGTFHYVRLRGFADARPEVYELTESGKAYAVTNNLC